MKLLLAYVLSLGLMLGGAYFAVDKAITQAAANAPAKPATAKVAIVAKSDKADEPLVDMNDPTLFDARGKFPQAMRGAMAKAKIDSTKDFASARAEQAAAAKQRELAQRKIRNRMEQQRRLAQSGDVNAYVPPQSATQAWNGFGFGF